MCLTSIQLKLNMSMVGHMSIKLMNGAKDMLCSCQLNTKKKFFLIISQ
jgi:hypothetical protein